MKFPNRVIFLSEEVVYLCSNHNYLLGGGWNLDIHKSLSLDGKIFAKKFGSLLLGNNAIKCDVLFGGITN